MLWIVALIVIIILFGNSRGSTKLGKKNLRDKVENRPPSKNHFDKVNDNEKNKKADFNLSDSTSTKKETPHENEEKEKKQNSKAIPYRELQKNSSDEQIAKKFKIKTLYKLHLSFINDLNNKGTLIRIRSLSNDFNESEIKHYIHMLEPIEKNKTHEIDNFMSLISLFKKSNKNADIDELHEKIKHQFSLNRKEMSNLSLSPSEIEKVTDIENNIYHEECPKIFIKDTSLSSQFNKYGIHSLWHMCHRDNIKSILQYGILSYSQAKNLVNYIDISNTDVQSRRESYENIYNRKIHDYSPTYIKIKNPMLYVKKDLREDLCIIEISLSVINDNNFIFSDGNAASSNTKFYNSTKDLVYLPWDVLNAEFWNDFEDGKRKKCAEVLIYPVIDSCHIINIHCFSTETLKKISQIHHTAKLSRNLFF